MLPRKTEVTRDKRAVRHARGVGILDPARVATHSKSNPEAALAYRATTTLPPLNPKLGICRPQAFGVLLRCTRSVLEARQGVGMGPQGEGAASRPSSSRGDRQAQRPRLSAVAARPDGRLRYTNYSRLWCGRAHNPTRRIGRTCRCHGSTSTLSTGRDCCCVRWTQTLRFLGIAGCLQPLLSAAAISSRDTGSQDVRVTSPRHLRALGWAVAERAWAAAGGPPRDRGSRRISWRAKQGQRLPGRPERRLWTQRRHRGAIGPGPKIWFQQRLHWRFWVMSSRALGCRCGKAS